jgi:hypothetical protein
VNTGTDIAAVIRELVPFGILGLAIIAVLFIALIPRSNTSRAIALLAMFIIAVLAIFDRLNPAPRLEKAPESSPQKPSVRVSGNTYWVSTGTKGDWGGRDIAFTAGSEPRYDLKGMVLCDENRDGSVAVCWDDRPTGYPLGRPTDVLGAPPNWCTYKDSNVRLSTPPDGRSPGKV